MRFLGGWRNTLTGVVYYNACTQTRRRGRSGEETYDEITQTADFLDEFTATQHDAAVQVYFLPDARDRSVSPRNPRDWDIKEADSRLDERILESVVKIQRFYRSRRRGNPTIHLPDVAPDTTAQTDPQHSTQEPASYRSTDFVILNRTSPHTRQDFELLHNLLDRWRILETERASRTFFEPSRVALCSLILSREVELLRALDSRKTALDLRRREGSYRRFLDELSRPIRWRNSRGEPILVDTPRVRCARQLRDVYCKLSREELPVPERMELLCDLRRDVKLHTCRQSHEMIYLIDQELDLLGRNVCGARLNWLRNRLKLTFLRLARNSLRVDLDKDVSWMDTGESSGRKFCRHCGRLLPIEKFPREHRTCSSACNCCVYRRARTGPRVVYEPYERMLREVRRTEAKMGCYGSLAFVVDSKIVCRLVNDIWHGKSAISENENFDELKLVRFRRDAEWAPWNNLLLTRKEAAVHLTIDDLNGFYGSMLLQKFRTKNLQAKVYFEAMSEFRRNETTR